ncbi:hypothetical protein YC2023_093559 [Brassica napus]
MTKFGESAARIKGSDGFVAGFVGGAIEFHERCEDYGSYGNRGVSRDDANKTMQRDPLVTRNDKATAERLDSVEKQIATIGEDSSAVMGIVTVLVFPDVDLRQWISWMEHYFARKGLTDFEKLHMAYGFIVDEAERYISGIDSLMPIRSWKHMKETLLWQFGADDDPEKIRMKASYDRGHKAFLEWEADKRRRSQFCSGDAGVITFTAESTSHNAIVSTSSNKSVFATKMVKKKITSPTVEEVSGDYPVHGHFSPDIILMEESLPEAAQEAEVNLQEDSFHEMEKHTGLKGAVVASGYVEQTDSCNFVEKVQLKKMNHARVQEADMLLKKGSLAEIDKEMDLHCVIGPVPSCYSEVSKLKDESTCGGEAVPEIERVSKTSSPTEEDVSVSFGDYYVLGCSLPELMLKLDSFPTAGLETVEMNSSATEVTEEKHWTEISQPTLVEEGWEHSVHDLSLVMPLHSVATTISSAEKSSLKSMLREVTKTDDEIKSFQIVISKSDWVYHTFLLSLMTRRIACTKRQRKCFKTWKFKFKMQKFVLRFTRHWEEPMNTRWMKERYDAVYGSRLRHKHISLVICKMRLIHTIKELEQFSLEDGKFQVKHKWRFKPASVLVFVWEHVVADKFSAGSVVNMGIMSGRDHNHFSVLLEQRGVMWRWVCSDLTMSVADTRPEWQRSLIIFFCVCLRASFISRASVYKRILKWLWRLKVLIVWFSTVTEYYIFEISVGKHKETTEPSTLWWIQVVNLQLHKERRAVLLMSIRRYRLQVWVQQKLKWKRNYKTWMFKYKERMKQVHALLLHVEWCLWSSSYFLWHRWRSRGNSTCSSEMAGLVEIRKTKRQGG